MASPRHGQKDSVPGASAEDEGEGRLLRDPAAGTELHGLHGKTEPTVLSARAAEPR